MRNKKKNEKEEMRNENEKGKMRNEKMVVRIMIKCPK